MIHTYGVSSSIFHGPELYAYYIRWSRATRADLFLLWSLRTTGFPDLIISSLLLASAGFVAFIISGSIDSYIFGFLKAGVAGIYPFIPWREFCYSPWASSYHMLYRAYIAFCEWIDFVSLAL